MNSRWCTPSSSILDLQHLSSEKQSVKLNGVIYSWRPTTAGVLQETKLGPIFFLFMLNNLGLFTPLNCNYWKYIDDISPLETLVRDQ